MSGRLYSKFFILSIFTFALGFGATRIANNVQKPEGFSREEALSHLHKKVRMSCASNPEETIGRTMYIEKTDFDGQIRVVVDWDHSWRGKHEIISVDKFSYPRCIEEIGEAEY